MNDDPIAPPGSGMQAYLCATCAWRCLVVGQERGPRCICGGELTPVLLSPGQYGLSGQEADLPRYVGDPSREGHALPTHAPIEQEADLGFGASHGYDKGHGGPSGPGDVPAKLRIA